VLFVSHNLEAITALCSQAMLLQKGMLVQAGPVAQVTAAYAAGLGADASKNSAQVQFPVDESKHAQILGYTIRDPRGAPVLRHDITEPMTVEIDYDLRRDFPNLVVCAHVHRNDGYLIYASHDGDHENLVCKDMQDVFPKRTGRYRASVTLPAPVLNTGIYELALILTVPTSAGIVDMKTGILFEVTDPPGGSFMSFAWKQRRSGLLAMPIEWTIRSREDGKAANAPPRAAETASARGTV
jgi:lipopolysaccharide transport system ATP-binding protein